MAKRDYDYLFKFVIIGDSGVGKSSLLLRFADDVYADARESTVGIDFRYRTVVMDNVVVKLQMWDTAGQERYRTVTAAYYRGCDAVMLVFDMSNRASFRNIRNWHDEFSKRVTVPACKLLVGNKSDLTEAVSEAEAQDLARELGMTFLPTSAKTTTNVSEAFITLTKTLIDTTHHHTLRRDRSIAQIKPAAPQKTPFRMRC